MQIEHLCDLEWNYRAEDVWGEWLALRPYGTDEAVGIGTLVGRVTGEKLRGALHCVNHPRVRSDGIVLPDVHGVIRTDDGSPIFCTFQGRTVFRGERGDVLLRVMFATEAEPYRWLNTAFGIYEGVVNPQPGGRIFLCINELAETPA